MARLEKRATSVSATAMTATRPSLPFEQLASFVAIRQTQRQDEVLRQLILHLVVNAPTGTYRSTEMFGAELSATYGLRMTDNALQPAVDGLMATREMLRDSGGAFTVSTEVRAAILKRVEDARSLEADVRDGWGNEVKTRHSEVDADAAWRALEAYLTRAFKQHGLLTMSLIDPSLEVTEAYQVGLRGMLNDALNGHCPKDQHEKIAQSISDFLLSAGSDSKRSAFIAALADCTVSYYSLTVSPDVAAQLRAQLKPLTIFLDTNVLFGLVDLDDRPVVHVSNELVGIVGEHKLPFRLRYHEATEHELRTTFDSAVSRLTGNSWSPGISRAAAKSNRVTTIQRLYHERNAEHPITPESFFKPFNHLDVLIQEKGIKLYREAASVDKQRVYDLMADYSEFLKKANREKPYDAIEHDMSLLDCARRMRSKANSSLEAEALVVTTDNLLWRFDRIQCRKSGGLPTMILPNQLLQLLRPFVPITTDFDSSFADAFAIPEFRALSRGGSAATGRLLEIIAAHGNVSERVATILLSNDLFLDGLGEKSEADVYRFVESAIAAENDLLVRERTELVKVAAEERARADAAEAVAAASSATEIAKLRVEVSQAAEVERRSIQKRSNDEVAEQARLRAEAVLRAEAEAARADAERKRAEDAEKRWEETEQALANRRKIDEDQRVAARERNRAGLGIIVGIVIAVALEFVWRKGEFTWLLDHPNGYGIRGCISFAAVAGSLAIFRRDWWKGCLWGMIVPAVLVVLQMVGGRRIAHQEPTPPVVPSAKGTPATSPPKP